VRIGFIHCREVSESGTLSDTPIIRQRGKMRIHIAAALALLLVPAFSIAQQSTAPDGDLNEVRRELSDALQLLRQTRQELQESQAQIKTLRSEVDSIKAGMPGRPSPGTEIVDNSTLAETQALTESRMAQIYQTKVESGSKHRVTLSGMVLFNAGVNRGTVDNSDVPMLAVAGTPGQTRGDINATMRQTMFDIGVTGPEWGGARTSADVQFDFFGGFQGTRDGTALGLMRLRTGHAQVEWDEGSIVVEQDQPFISPLTPTSLATLGTPAFGYAGNLWTWTPQIVATRRFTWADTTNSTLQVGVLDPFSGDIASGSYDRIPEPGERSRVPAIAARHALNFEIGKRKFTLGTSGLYSRHDYGFGRVVNGFTGALDWMLPVASKVEWSGEFYRGRAVGGMWGAIGTSVAYEGPIADPATEVYPVNSIGGWTQLKFAVAQKWEVNSAFGIDNPYARDLRHFWTGASYQPLLRNSSEMLNIMHRPRSNLVLSLEYRHLNTVNFTSRRYTAENVNLGIGVHF
jgi:hypothetical protein